MYICIYIYIYIYIYTRIVVIINIINIANCHTVYILARKSKAQEKNNLYKNW